MGYRILSMAMLCLFACFIATDAGQEKPDETAIRVLEAKWVDAYKQRQVTALATLLAEDYVITTEDGTTYSKVGFISYNSGPLHVDEAAMSDLKIRIHENVAVVTGAYRERGSSQGKAYDYNDRMTDVWMKINGKWQLIASHYSIPAKS